MTVSIDDLLIFYRLFLVSSVQQNCSSKVILSLADNIFENEMTMSSYLSSIVASIHKQPPAYILVKNLEHYSLVVAPLYLPEFKNRWTLIFE